MARAITLARSMQFDSIELLRKLVVCFCALALIAAGHILPF